MKITATIEMTSEEVVNFVKALRGGLSAKQESTSAPVVRKKKVVRVPNHKKVNLTKEEAEEMQGIVRKVTPTPSKTPPAKRKGAKKASTKPRTSRRWTEEEVAWLKKHMKNRPKSVVSKATVAAFKKQFGYERSAKSLSMKSQEIHGMRDKFKGKKTDR